KSTLINAILDQKIAAVSPRPQTTRKRQLGILTINASAQIIFMDTPGIHQPRHKLGVFMNEEAAQTLQECDLILFVADVSQPPTDDDRLLFSLLHKTKTKDNLILALNKIDQVEPDILAARQEEFTSNLPGATPIPISASNGTNLDQLLKIIQERLPAGDPFFPEEQLTDLSERDLAADLIRAAALSLLRDEVPHGIAVRMDQYQERNEHGAYIEATLFLERESHKAIVIGKDGQMLKKIGTLARQAVEEMSGRKVYLHLKVKVRKNWRDDEKTLRQFRY
ncbi:MAG: GTPase Era, partial [Anaerolineales bacterium]|nr:GTPase Era [Anaerolineales bacterium]